MDAGPELMVADESVETGLEGLILVEGMADEEEPAAGMIAAPRVGEAQEEVLALPGSEPAEDSDQRFGVRDPQGGPHRAARPGFVAFEGDAVVDGGEPGGGPRKGGGAMRAWRRPWVARRAGTSAGTTVGRPSTHAASWARNSEPSRFHRWRAS